MIVLVVLFSITKVFLWISNIPKPLSSEALQSGNNQNYAEPLSWKAYDIGMTAFC
jgi:hypothetical protein